MKYKTEKKGKKFENEKKRRKIEKKLIEKYETKQKEGKPNKRN